VFASSTEFQFLKQKSWFKDTETEWSTVSEGSAQQFAADDKGLSTLLEEVNSTEYMVTKRSRAIMEGILKDIYGDGCIFKEFEGEIQPLCDISPQLREISNVADSLADKTKEETFDVARALLIDLPKQDDKRST
jgi:hypothetical protein